MGHNDVYVKQKSICIQERSWTGAVKFPAFPRRNQGMVPDLSKEFSMASAQVLRAI
jgi:hypothetical protein